MDNKPPASATRQSVRAIGRFAPSPTGDLHFGSLVSAIGSYLEVKTGNGNWLVRIEDIDPPREVSGSSQRIIDDLLRLGMVPDNEILYQSSRLEAYQRAIVKLRSMGLAYDCACSRKDLPSSGIYPGTCRQGIAGSKQPRSVRFRVTEAVNGFTDRLQGDVAGDPAETNGDFIIHRADGLVAYQLAVVIDDNSQGITQIVRGADLLGSTFRQICLYKALGFDLPEYMHLPVATTADGKKISKRLKADPVRNQDPAATIRQALDFLGQQPPPGLSLKNIWDWALNHWDRDRIPRKKSIFSEAL